MTSARDLGESTAQELGQTSVRPDLQHSDDRESRPWENVLEEIRVGISGDDDDESCPSEDEDGESTIKRFMQGPEQSEDNVPEADVLEDYCSTANLEVLRAGPPFAPDGPDGNANIWLDERIWDSGAEVHKKSRWYTVHPFYKEERKPPLEAPRTGIPAPIDGNDTAPAASGPGGDPSTSASAYVRDQVDQGTVVTRQLIYIHDPDQWNIFALIGSAKYHQAAGLRLALYRHFSSKTSIDVSFSSDGYPAFHLAFSLPYWAWRKSKRPVLDLRQNKTREPLRGFRDVSRLDPGSGRLCSFIYEAQITFVITGLLNERRWKGLCFDDIHYNGKYAQTAHQHSEEVEAGATTDPISFGVTWADYPYEPFEYFIRILEIRLNRIKDEWKKTIHKMTESIRRYESKHFPLSQPQPHYEVDSQQPRLDDSLDLVMGVKSLATTLLDTLTKTVDACTGFQELTVPEILNVPDASHQQRLLSLPAIYRELRTLQKDLQSLVKRAGEFAHQLEFRLMAEMNKTSTYQRELTETSNKLAQASNELTKTGHGLAENSNKLTETSNDMARYNGALATIMLLFFSPIALGSGIFSMDPDVIRLLPRTFGSFLAFVVGFALFGYAILQYAPHNGGFWQRCLVRTKSLRCGNCARAKTIFVEILHFLCRPLLYRGPSAEAIYADLVRYFQRLTGRASNSQPTGEDMSLSSWRLLFNRQQPPEQPVDTEAQSQHEFSGSQALPAIGANAMVMQHINCNES